MLLIGAGRVADGSTDAGDLVSIAYLFTLLALPIRAIGWVLADLPRALAGFDRVTPVLDATGETPYGPDAAATGDGGAGLGVRRRRLLVRRDVAADAPRGHLRRDRRATVAVVGPTGSGKSTLAGLLVRLVDPADGTVLLDGVDLRSLREGEVSGQAAFVAQGTFLFDDTVRGNVTLGADFPDDEVWAALRVAAADDFVAALPRGWTPASASAARRCPAVSASGWRSRAPSSGGRACWCSTTRRAPSTPPSRRGSSTRCGTANGPRPSW